MFIDGQFIEEAQASIPITDRGFLFGDGIFSTLKVAEGEIENLDVHLLHLQAQCQAIELVCPRIEKSWLEELIRRNHALEGVWRLKIIVTGGDDPALHLSKRQGRLIATVKPVNKIRPKEMRLCIYPIPFSSPLASVKSLSYLDRLHIASYAERQRCDEALVLSPEGHALETAFANIFWRQDGAFFSPEPGHNLLLGATLAQLTEQYKIRFVKKRVEEIAAGAQLFLCNSILGIVPVVRIGDQTFARDFALEASLNNRV